MKELPKVYANPIDKPIDNNISYCYGKLVEDRIQRDEKYVIDQINKLLKKENTLYSIDCTITYFDTKETCTIIGKTKNSLVTKSQRVIPIKDIYDIELAK